MTEYDFSPDAYERHMKNQLRVHNWVSSQSSHMSNYPNPFMPTAYISTKPLPPDTAFTSSQQKPTVRSRSSTITPSSVNTARQPPVRSRTIHDTHSSAEQSRRHTPSRSRTIPADAQPPISSSSSIENYSSSSKHHRSSTRPPSRNRSPSRARSPPRSPTRNRSPSRNKSPTRSHTTTTTRAHTVPIPNERDANGRKIIQLDQDSINKVLNIPQPRPGEQYVIIPPPGGKVEVLNGKRTEQAKPPSPPSTSPKMKQQQQPERAKSRERDGGESSSLMKRLLGGLTNRNQSPAGTGTSPSSPNGGSGFIHRRRKSD